METLIVVGIGLGIGIIRCTLLKKGTKSKKIKYYNYSKYEVRYKKLNNSLSDQSRIKF